MKDAVFKLIFKKNYRLLLKNWRPISLLNTDYKILSKTLANRITPLLSKIILPNQKCGLPKRRIEQLLCNIQAVFEIAKEKNEKFGLIAVDFEKAFDCLSHKFIFKIFKSFGFGQTMLTWLELLYKNTFSHIEINGVLTNSIQMKRGIRQGCRINMLFFIAATNMLTKHIEQQTRIKGFLYQNTHLKILQYADDTTFLFQNFESLNQILKELQSYETVSGLSINKSKTQIITNDNTTPSSRISIGRYD